MENNFNINKIELPFLKNTLKYRKIIILVFLSLLLFFSAFFQIEPEEVGVITRFGKYVRKVEPGLNMKMPFIERVYKVPVERQQKLEFGFRTVRAGVNTQYTRSGAKDESLMLTGDLNLADVNGLYNTVLMMLTIIYLR